MSDSEPRPQPKPVRKRSDGPPKPPTKTTLDLMNEGEVPPEALKELFRRHWTPVYGYIRRRGHGPSQAEDLTQSFIASFLQGRTLPRLDESKGRFGSLLLVSLKNFLSNEWARSQPQKSGGWRQLASLAQMAPEEDYCATAPDLSPDAIYDNLSALAVLGHALAQLERDEVKRGRGAQFRRLQFFLKDHGADEIYRAAGAELGLSPEAVAMALSRLHGRIREALRTEIAATVQPERVEQELRCLAAALRGR